MAFDWKKKLKDGFTKAKDTYTAIDDAIEKQKNKAISAIEDKIATAGKKPKDAAKPDAPATPPAPEAPK